MLIKKIDIVKRHKNQNDLLYYEIKKIFFLLD
jgi:hypothetical protein